MTLPTRALDYVTARSTSFGERHGLGWLMYGPLQMLAYHRQARQDAPGVIGALLGTFPAAVRIADVGSGSGAFAARAARQGRTVFACEHSWGGRLVGRLQGVRVIPFDLDRHPPAALPHALDLTYCFEVAEHCSPAQGDRLVRFLVRLAPLVLFTAAHPGQGGLGHINEQQQDYWIGRFADAGATYRPDLVERFNGALNGHGQVSPWFHQNLMVFSREAKTDA
jgi:SAM-dependent methyltransferase